VFLVRILTDETVFATLAVASAEEDKYGHVQGVLPSTLEAIVRLRSALFSLESELLAKSSALGKSTESAQAEVRQLVGESTTGKSRLGSTRTTLTSSVRKGSAENRRAIWQEFTSFQDASRRREST